MDFGVCVAAKVDDVGYVAHAERLGYSHAWVADSQMIWSDCYAVLALAAQQTTTIKLGTGVAVAGTRLAPVTAASIATVNRLAPGRTFLGIGTGNTAMRLMGHKPLSIREFDEYLAVLRPLLSGGEADFTWRGRTAPVRHMMPDLGFVDVEHPIPLYVSGFGPRAQGLAGKHGDGLVASLPPDPGAVARALNHVRAGAAEAGRELAGDFPVFSLTTAVVLDPGEPLDSERVLREAGAFVASSLHYHYDQVRQYGGEPPAHLRAIWDDYAALVEATPEDHLHQRIHAGHCTWLLPEEARFVTPELVRRTCLVGTADELVERVRALGAAGLAHVMLLPSLEAQYESTERFSREVMARL